MTYALQIVLAISATYVAVQSIAAWWHLRRSGPPADPTAQSHDQAWTPPVSILKPISGLEDGLRANLRSFLHLDYPDYEMIFCLQNPGDRALPLLRELQAGPGGHRVVIVVGDYSEGLNPKISNLIPGYHAARHDLVLISDANVRVRPGYLREAVSHMRDPQVGLVSHVVRGARGATLGAHLDNGYLNTFVVGSVALLEHLGISCVIGKSMLMRKQDLAAFGGLESVKDFLAEDFALAARIKRAGLRVIISPVPVDRVAIRTSTRTFLRRYTRWNAMRRTISGPAYLLEPLANPIPIALVAVIVAMVGVGARTPVIVTAASVVLMKMLLDAGVQMALGVPLSVREVLLTPLRDVLLLYAWAGGFWTHTVVWHDRRLRLGRGSKLRAPDARPIRTRLKDPRSLPVLRRVMRARRQEAG